MTDLALGGLWLGVLGGGIAACVLASMLGLASTYVRDALHIGAGVWVLGWPYWHGGAIPIAIVCTVAVATFAMPFVAPHNRLAARIVRSVTSGDEHWTGLTHYTAMYATCTALALVGDPFPAGAALLALSLGDGIGGAVGRNFGRHRYQLPGAKMKSFEGSAVVLIAAAVGVAIAAPLFGREVGTLTMLALGAVAALTEAVAPRGTDNLLIPIAVWTTATLVT
jgi:dolichol kinase